MGILFHWIRRNEKSLKIIKEKEKERKDKEIKRIQKEEKIINNKIDKFI